MFFACMQISPLLAVIATLIIAPAIIRTSLLREMHRKESLPFDWKLRINYFAQSLCVVLLTSVFAAAVFVLVSLLFGLTGWLLSISVGGTKLSLDAAVVGTAGGMVWGIGGAILATGYVILKSWLPAQIGNKPIPKYQVDLRM